MKTTSGKSSFGKLSPVFLLISAGSLMMVSNLNMAIPAAAWIYPVCMMRFLRVQKAGRGLAAGLVISILAACVMNWRLLSLDYFTDSFRLTAGVAMGILLFLPFIADRLISVRLRGVKSTLIFPAVFTVMEYLVSLSPNGTWGALAYTQYGSFSLMQLASVTGMWGITFIISWFASTANYIVENGMKERGSIRAVSIYAAVLVGVLLYGGARLAFPTTPDRTVCAAGLTSLDEISFQFDSPDWKNNKDAHARSMRQQEDFLQRTKLAAGMGAQIVCWQEYATAVFEEDEDDFKSRAVEIARHEKLYLLAPYALLTQDPMKNEWKNKLLWVDPEGEIIAEYRKTRPSGVLEKVQPGSGVIPVIDSPWGKMAAAICTDQEYPRLIRQAGAAGADLLFVPSAGWKGVSPLHTRMAAFRAVENGLSIVKPNCMGVSAAIGPAGLTITEQDYWTVESKTMIAHIPLSKDRTFYAVTGDWFAWLCFILLIALTVSAVKSDVPGAVS